MTTKKLSERSREERSPSISIVYFTPALAWGIFILYFSLLPGPQIPRALHQFNDKFMHAGIYFISALLIYLGFIRFNLKNPLSKLYLGVIIVACVLFGSAIELLQHYLIANRAGEWSDFLANTTGAAACVLVLYFTHGRRV